MAPRIETIRTEYLGMFVNSFVVATADSNIFIDCGLFWGSPSYEPFLREGKKPYVLNTHGHWDHIGMAAVLQDRGAAIRAHPADARFFREFDWHWHHIFGQFKDETAIPETRAPLFWSSLDRPVEIDRPVAGGEILAIGGVEFESLHTPGHTPGCLCFLEKETGTLFTGDALVGKGLGSSLPQYVDCRAYRASLERLRGVCAETVLAAHSDPLPGRLLSKMAEEGIEAVDCIDGSLVDYLQRHERENLKLGEICAEICRQANRSPGFGLCASVLAHLGTMQDRFPETGKVCAEFDITV